MDFEFLAVGQKVCAPSSEGVTLDLSESGYTLIYRFNHPTAAEKRNLKSGAYQFKAVMLDGVLFFLSRFGNQPWCDAPFHRGLAQARSAEKPEEGNGNSLLVLLVDASTGILQTIRLIGLSHKFSMQLIELIEKHPEQAPVNWQQTLASIFARYTTEQMVEMAVIEN